MEKGFSINENDRAEESRQWQHEMGSNGEANEAEIVQ